MTFDFSRQSVTQAIASFKKSVMRGPFHDTESKWSFDINDDTLFKDAVWQGYLDTTRTFRKIDTKTEKRAFDHLAESIQGYLDGHGAFKHADWCNNFMSDIDEYNGYKAKYGQAQKVVNMAFKYLYCCSGAPEDRFTPCHMPLDKITLTWLSYETGTYYDGWSYFAQKRYEAVQGEIRGILGDHILDKELVIYEQLRPKCVVDLKKEYGHDIE